MRGSYGVTTMGAFDDDSDGYNDQFPTFNPYTRIGDLEGDGPAASESGYTDGESSGRGVGMATANPLTSSSSSSGGGGGALVVRPPSMPHAGGGGFGGGGLAPAIAAPGMFGDLFGPQTDTIVLAAGLVVLGGLVYLTMTHKKPAAGRRAARR